MSVSFYIPIVPDFEIIYQYQYIIGLVKQVCSNQIANDTQK